MQNDRKRDGGDEFGAVVVGESRMGCDLVNDLLKELVAKKAETDSAFVLTVLL